MSPADRKTLELLNRAASLPRTAAPATPHIQPSALRKAQHIGHMIFRANQRAKTLIHEGKLTSEQGALLDVLIPRARERIRQLLSGEREL